MKLENVFTDLIIVVSHSCYKFSVKFNVVLCQLLKYFKFLLLSNTVNLQLWLLLSNDNRLVYKKTNLVVDYNMNDVLLKSK